MVTNKTVLGFMGKDHDRLDSIFKKFRSYKNIDKNKAIKLFHEFKSDLQRHIVWEEEILFPLFERKTGMNDGPTVVMRMDHNNIKDLLERIINNLNRDIPSKDLENELVLILTDHNEKEESLLYPWIDNSVNNKEREEIFVKIKNLS